MRILVCASEAPLPPLNGFRLQLIPVCELLAARGHAVCVVAFRRPDQGGEPPPGVDLQLVDYPPRRELRAAAKWAFGRRPLGPIVEEERMLDAARTLLSERDFDVLHVDGFPLAGVGPALPELPALLTALDAHHLNYAARRDAAQRPARWLYDAEVRRIVRFEALTYPAYSGVVVVSEEDRRALLEIDPALSVEVVPNGVDAEHFSPAPGIEPDPRLVVMTGAMHWAPNVAAATYLVEEVLPHLRERVPGVRVAIVGRGPVEQVTRLAEHDDVEVTGEVPEMRDWLVRAGAYACPMVNGTGIKNKLLEAMACARPCVVTPLARGGLAVEDGREVLVAPDARQFAGALGRVLDDVELAERLGAAARRNVLDSHSWPAVCDRYERLLSRAIEGAR